MFIGPLFWKEILEGLKKRRTYVFRGIYVGALFIAVVVLWPGSTELAAGSGEALVELMFWLQFLIVALTTPILTATTLTAEKQAGSLELLLLTRFNSFEVILGKFLSRAVQIEMLLVCALPVFSLVINVGGVDLRTILAGFAIVTTLLLLCGMAGIACAVHARRIHSAALASYFVIAFVLYPLPSGIHYLAQWLFDASGAGATAPQWAPSAALTQVLDPPPGADVTWYWVRPAAVCCAAALAMYLHSAWSLRNACIRGSAVVAPTMLKLWRLLAAARDRLTGGGDLDREIEEGNPVIWREIRMRTLPNSIATVAAYTASMIAVGMVGFAGYSRGVTGLLLLLWLSVAFNGALAIGAGVLAATAFVREKEGRTMQSLLTSLLTAREIIQGKEEGLRRCLRLGVLMMILFVAVVAFAAEAGILEASWAKGGRATRDYHVLLSALVTPVIGFLCVRFYVVQALYLSMRSSTTTRALVLTLIITTIELFLGAFVPIVAFLNPVGCSLVWSGGPERITFLVIGLGISYLLYRWVITRWLHKMLVRFQVSAETAR